MARRGGPQETAAAGGGEVGETAQGDPLGQGVAKGGGLRRPDTHRGSRRSLLDLPAPRTALAIPPPNMLMLVTARPVRAGSARTTSAQAAATESMTQRTIRSRPAPGGGSPAAWPTAAATSPPDAKRASPGSTSGPGRTSAAAATASAIDCPVRRPARATTTRSHCAASGRPRTPRARWRSWRAERPPTCWRSPSSAPTSIQDPLEINAVSGSPWVPMARTAEAVSWPPTRWTGTPCPRSRRCQRRRHRGQDGQVDTDRVGDRCRTHVPVARSTIPVDARAGPLAGHRPGQVMDGELGEHQHGLGPAQFGPIVRRQLEHGVDGHQLDAGGAIQDVAADAVRDRLPPDGALVPVPRGRGDQAMLGVQQAVVDTPRVDADGGDRSGGQASMQAGLEAASSRQGQSHRIPAGREAARGGRGAGPPP